MGYAKQWQTQFRRGSQSVSGRPQGAVPCRLKPGLHTPRQAHVCDRTVYSLLPLYLGQSGGAMHCPRQLWGQSSCQGPFRSPLPNAHTAQTRPTLPSPLAHPLFRRHCQPGASGIQGRCWRDAMVLLSYSLRILIVFSSYSHRILIVFSSYSLGVFRVFLSRLCPSSAATPAQPCDEPACRRQGSSIDWRECMP